MKSGSTSFVLYLDGHCEPLIEELHIASGFLKRAVGLLALSDLPSSKGLLIPDCTSIHTFCMRFSIDVIFFDEEGNIRVLYPHVPSGHVLFSRRKNVSALEVKSGFIERYNLKEGDKLKIVDQGQS